MQQHDRQQRELFKNLESQVARLQQGILRKQGIVSKDALLHAVGSTSTLPTKGSPAEQQVGALSVHERAVLRQQEAELASGARLAGQTVIAPKVPWNVLIY